jgi:hypothetical protein
VLCALLVPLLVFTVATAAFTVRQKDAYDADKMGE